MPACAGLPNRPLALPGLVGVTHPHRSRCDEAEPCSLGDWQSPAHSPCSQVHARPAGSVTTAAGGLLPHRFTPHPHPSTCRAAGGSAFCCGCSQRRLMPRCPHLSFRGAPLPRSIGGAESREVPLGSRIGSQRWTAYSLLSLEPDYTSNSRRIQVRQRANCQASSDGRRLGGSDCLCYNDVAGRKHRGIRTGVTTLSNLPPSCSVMTGVRRMLRGREYPFCVDRLESRG